MRASGIALKNVTLDDPGFLIGKIAEGWPQVKKEYRLGIAAPYVDRMNPWVQSLLATWRISNVHADPEIFLANLAGCEAVASSSLHGLIFAEALRVPNVWIELSGKVHGGGFKFRDWFSLAERAERNTRKVMKRFHLAQGGSAHIRIADGLKSIQHRTGDACRIAISGRAISDGKKRDERVRRR
jgi:hypothetical protein